MYNDFFGNLVINCSGLDDYFSPNDDYYYYFDDDDLSDLYEDCDYDEF